MVESKIFTRAEIAQDSSPTKPLIIINNSVYDVTSFLNEHPGGEEVLLEQAGKDATEQFEDVGHSTDAREMMNKYKVGELAESEKNKEKAKEKPKWDATDTENSSSWTAWVIPATIAIAVTVIYRFLFAK